ncbi:uncharacterized protein LOC125952113 [Anopheles darlingi]|uniref:uncharacterized protein LOC125952113 n=1 Tax=Anopheles darlingi TaxID=43151 RepID=UPI0021003865|nr:uncharacterized protein LOC125952113 [Anopheles darlingi]
MVKQNSDWMVISFEDLPIIERRPAFYNVFFVQDYASLCNIISHMDSGSYEFSGYYTVFLEQSDSDVVSKVMEKLWNSSIINAMVICRASDEEYVAYTYYPYRANKCGMVEPIEHGRLHIGDKWVITTSDWFGDRIANFHGCPLKVGTVEVQPYSMSRREGNATVYFGLEMFIAEAIAEKLQFSIDCLKPQGKVRWGIMHPTNSTGLVGMIQRKEVDFGFGSLGYSLSRNKFLKATPSHLTQMIMAIPPQKPYTSLEKLFQPFTIDAWICIAVGYLIFGMTTLLLAKFNPNAISERIHYPLYTLWILLMGGSAGKFQLNSSRAFIIGFIVNTLVVRTLYQAGMFKRLQASASLASDLNTISAINKAGLTFSMYRSTSQFYKDNPMVPASRIRIINDSINFDDAFYALSKHKLDEVIALPLDIIAYYVKKYGTKGIIYAAGITQKWLEQFRDDRYWNNAKEDPEPSSLKWNQISGGFLLCGVLLSLATLVFMGKSRTTAVQPV